MTVNHRYSALNLQLKSYLKAMFGTVKIVTKTVGVGKSLGFMQSYNGSLKDHILQMDLETLPLDNL